MMNFFKNGFVIKYKFKGDWIKNNPYTDIIAKATYRFGYKLHIHLMTLGHNFTNLCHCKLTIQLVCEKINTTFNKYLVDMWPLCHYWK